MYRIDGVNIEIFDISVSNFLIYHLSEFSCIHLFILSSAWQSLTGYRYSLS